METDLFASHLSFQLPHFFNWRPDPLTEGTDAFVQYWKGLKAYENPLEFEKEGSDKDRGQT